MKKLNCILLVDDNEADNLFHKIVMKQAGFTGEVRIAHTGFEALDLITGKDQPGVQPDLVLLDINMPGMNGFEFLERYMQLGEEHKRSIVVIMLTTSLNPDDYERSRSYEVIKDFYNKPLTKEALEEITGKYFS